MKKITLKSPAKINLTLDVTGRSNGYHTLKSLVASIDICDYITVKKRTDWDIKLTTKGVDPLCENSKNNAYIAAKLFSDTFITEGVEITIEKNIPVGAGLGGSSADTVGVLKAMKELFEVSGDITPLAEKLGSDTAFMLKGGFAVMSGRGEKVSPVKIGKTFYLIIITEDKGASSKDVYHKYDLMKKSYKPRTEKVYKAIIENDLEKFYNNAKNDLFPASSHFVPEMDFNIKLLKKAGAPLAMMTGSGSAVFGLFTDKKQRDKVYKQLKPLYNDNIFTAQTIEEY